VSQQKIEVQGKRDPTAQALANTSWLVVTQTSPVPAPSIGLGEPSVLAWALSDPGSEAIIDDLAARRCAGALSISRLWDAGSNIIAKQRGHASASPDHPPVTRGY